MPEHNQLILYDAPYENRHRFLGSDWVGRGDLDTAPYNSRTRQLLGKPNPQFLVDPSGECFIQQRVYPHGIPWIVFTSIKYLSYYIYDLLAEHFIDQAKSIARIGRKWWPDYFARWYSGNWNEMTQYEIDQMIQDALMKWWLDEHELFISQIRDFYPDECDAIEEQYTKRSRALENELRAAQYYWPQDSCLEHRPRDIERHLSALSRYFGGHARLLSDVAHCLEYADEDKLDLIALRDIPSRVEVLDRVAGPGTILSDMQRFTAELREQGHNECVICRNEWDVPDGEPEWTIASVLVQPCGTKISSHFGSVNGPYRMPCGHIFCVTCIQTMLNDQDGRLQCPFRDMDYGIHRPNVVREVEHLCRSSGKRWAPDSWATITLEARKRRFLDTWWEMELEDQRRGALRDKKREEKEAMEDQQDAE